MIFDFIQTHVSDSEKLAAVWLFAVCVLLVLYAVVSRGVDTIRYHMNDDRHTKLTLLLWDFLCWSSVLSLIGLAYYAFTGVSDLHTKTVFVLTMVLTLLLFFVLVTKKFFGKGSPFHLDSSAS